MKDNDFLKLVKTIEPEYDEAEIVTTDFLDSGSFMLNALISGSLYGGFPSNRVSTFGGSAGVGKTYFAMSAIKAFQEKFPDGNVIYIDTEFALDKGFFSKRNLDSSRIAILGAETLQDFRTKALNILKNYEEMKSRKPLMLVLDSLSNLPSAKEMEDGIEGKDVSDMTKAKLIRSIFRSITVKIGKLSVPMITTVHTYDVIGCLSGEINVKGACGDVNIKDIAIGDYVQTLMGNKKVTNLYNYDVEEYFELTLETGEVINATPNHKFLTKKLEWKRVDELSETDELLISSPAQ